MALCADPTYWLYGRLSFCAKSCEAKTTATGGERDFKTSKERKEESTAPALEPIRNSVALMQTVVMSCARGLHWANLSSRWTMCTRSLHSEALKLGEVPLEACKRYKHNADNPTNNPYVIVGVYEGRCEIEQYPPIPETPTPARASEEGILDARSFPLPHITRLASALKSHYGIRSRKGLQTQGKSGTCKAFACRGGPLR